MHSPEKRHFSRIHFSHGATLTFEGGELPCEVVDLSLKGAHIRLPAGSPPLASGLACALELRLDDGESRLRMEATVAHCRGRDAGLTCTMIDLDSITRLRRLIELNLGDDALLHRELHELVSL
ncbi:MAG: PilZ domain-containing protein [Thauera sp.]|jgi:hypothetical protein|nr:PilZ domain-containing protein [Thauera sp.]